MRIKKVFMSAAVALFVQCLSAQKQTKPNYSTLLAESVIKNNPQVWTTDFQKTPKWGYVEGLVCQSLQQLSEHTGNNKYYNYVKETYTDLLVDASGTIKGYNMETFRLDDINSGKILFSLYKKTKDERYLKAIETLHDQLKKQPRVAEGGFWHKKVYPNQMWLDGLYMGLPFYAQYATIFKDSDAFDDITNQLLLAQKHLKDSKTGLYYHGWDSSKSVYWANPETGLSKNFWGRGVGWLYMALVDVLEYLPHDHKNYAKVALMFQYLSKDLIRVQDKDSGVWFQVLDYPKREGNYLESTGSVMFAYGLCKGMQLGVLDASYLKPARSAYKGIFRNFVKEAKNGTLEITSCCAGAGLGPADNLVRNGTYEYYISEAVRSNDGKAIGPLIMTCIIAENNPKWNMNN